MNLSLRVAGKTDIGLVRSNNEDNFGFDTRWGIFLVCDGMGGALAGERASKIAVETVLTLIESSFRERHELENAETDPANLLSRAIQSANAIIHDEAAENAAQAGMGCTIVAILTSGNTFTIANVGDSRIYLIRSAQIHQLTEDHSLVMEQVRRGLMTQDEAERSGIQNIIVRSLGVQQEVEADISVHQFEAGDTLLLCTDGLCRFVPDPTIAEIVCKSHTPEQACDDLIEAAKNAGSDDNITCLLLRAAEPSRAHRILNALSLGANKYKRRISST
jgi:PPM family protein phosphatase